MKIFQFVNKLLYASSDTKHVVIYERGKAQGVELYTSEIVNPASKENPHRELLDLTLSSFRIRGEALEIYAK